ncbi:Ubiquitin carboxyl-terminal hydrolase CYLD [Oryzias melastigma]|uniref:Ubiquitin carboxyl-terminal hydrolase CYLD n=1 Tax=Oryzias melastigma TaxID=30732 RepID=A0A834F0Z8_ORYME|nr:Ubiquitin carboxyl-terminal hydrolase CYLD [Oryzias melastigma]
MTSTSCHYFIVTKKTRGVLTVNPGRLCYMTTQKYNAHQETTKHPKTLSVYAFDSLAGIPKDVEISCLEELSLEDAQLLLAVPDDTERLSMFSDQPAFQAARSLSVGTAVTVKEDGKNLRGVIRYIGKRTEPRYPNPISGTYYGVELQGSDRGKAKNVGMYSHETLFQYEKDCGILVPISRIKPVVPSSLSPSRTEPSGAYSDPQTDELSPGDRVIYFNGPKCRSGMVVEVQQQNGNQMVWISTDTDEMGRQGGEICIPLEMVSKGDIPGDITEPERIDFDTTPPEDYTNLDVNSMVEVILGKRNSYGIIRWIGKLPGREETMAGLELEEDLGVSDGTFKGTRFFRCPNKRALFVKLSSCHPDSRFHGSADDHKQEMSQPDYTEMDEDVSGENLEVVPPISAEQIDHLLIGRMKGIQGHCNSCYMDAALFSLFSCSSALDSMLFKTTTSQDAPIQKTLLRDIVIPLRSKGFVECRHVMKLRQLLQKHGYSRSFTTEEKDPEEFLIVVMHHILALEPLLKLSAAGKVQESYCYQIFLDQNHSLVLPTVQQLLEHSFHNAGLKLAEVPSCLILQMPRFGKKFKMFDKIIPSLELDITDLLSEGPQQCIMCGHLAVEECADCFKDPTFNLTGFKIFCHKCSTQVHSHPKRRSHQPTRLEIPKGYMGRSIPQTLIRDRLELYAVLCIETSHYVSFVKYGPNSHDWIFFDSMADRQGEMDGFNIPEVHLCPEVGTYLEMSPAELANQVPRDMKGVAKRLFCDAYMYLYQSTSMCLYR